MKKKVLFALVITIITDLLFIPIKGYGKYNYLSGRDNIYNIIKQNSCKMCLNYEISILGLIVQSILLFIGIMLIFKVFKKKEK